jgi:RNA polymerase subunit RPABC4/transcription elongation factor Spt4
MDVVQAVAIHTQLKQLHINGWNCAGGMLFDRETQVRLLNRLQASSDPDATSVAELIRGMDAALEHLADALSCSMSLADDKRQPCSFRLQGDECSCEHCGQLLSEWELRAAAALECALPDPAPLSEDSDAIVHALQQTGSPENLSARADKVQLLFRELEDVFGGLSLPARPAPEIRSTTAPYLRCEGCGATISVDVKFCSHCGRTVQGRRCISCNNVLDRQMNFCPACGSKAA